MNSIDVGRREPAVSSAPQPATKSPAELGTVHNVRSASYGALGTPKAWRPNMRCVALGTEVTLPVVLANHRLSLSDRVVESFVLSLLIGRDVVEGLGPDIKGGSKTLENNGRSQPLEDSVAGHCA